MKINVISAFGDPRSHSTWSGTTKNISDALEKIDSLEGAYEASENNFTFKVLKQACRLWYKLRFYKGKKQMMMPFRFGVWRHLSAYSGSIFLKEAKYKNLLHFSTLSLPESKMISFENHNHFCVIDATWNLWEKNSTNIGLISKSSQKVIEKLEKQSFEQVKHIFSISEYVKHNLINHYKIPEAKITVVGTGTGIITPYYGSKDYSNGKILFVAKGRFEDKGGPIVLEAFDLLLKKYPHLELHIVGQNDYSAMIKHPQISTYGFIPLNELQELFNTCSLFIMPALHEPWGLVYIEAMLCKMPIIGLNRNAFPEISNYGKFGIGVDSPDANSIALSIDAMLSDVNKMREIGEKAQTWALEKFTWDNVAKRIMDVVKLY